MITGPLFLLRVFKGKVRAAPEVGITIWADPSPVVIGNRGLPRTPRITGVRSSGTWCRMPGFLTDPIRDTGFCRTMLGRCYVCKQA